MEKDVRIPISDVSKLLWLAALVMSGFFVCLAVSWEKGDADSCFFHARVYDIWWGIRVASLLMILPVMLIAWADNDRLRNWLYQTFLICATVPVSLILAYGQGIEFYRLWGWEFILAALQTQIFYAFSWPGGHDAAKIYYPALFSLAATPIAVYYCYWEIWHNQLPWLLWISPCWSGWACLGYAAAIRLWAELSRKSFFSNVGNMGHMA